MIHRFAGGKDLTDNMHFGVSFFIYWAWRRMDGSINGQWMDDLIDGETDMYAYIWLDVYLLVPFSIVCYVSSERLCGILSFNT